MTTARLKLLLLTAGILLFAVSAEGQVVVYQPVQAAVVQPSIPVVSAPAYTVARPVYATQIVARPVQQVPVMATTVYRPVAVPAVTPVTSYYPAAPVYTAPVTTVVPIAVPVRRHRPLLFPF